MLYAILTSEIFLRSLSRRIFSEVFLCCSSVYIIDKPLFINMITFPKNIGSGWVGPGKLQIQFDHFLIFRLL